MREERGLFYAAVFAEAIFLVLMISVVRLAPPHALTLATARSERAQAASSGTTYYVSSSGSDSNPGTSINAPFQTIQKAADVAVAGDTVFIRGGTYREQVDVVNSGTPGNDINFFAYPGETPVIKATDVVTGWTPYQGDIWEKQNWGFDSQQVFVDFDASPGPPLQQIGIPAAFRSDPSYYPFPVGTGLADMAPGTFYYDPATGTLYVWLVDGSDPNDHVVEAGKRDHLFFDSPTGGGYVHLKGLTFRFSNVTATEEGWPAISLQNGIAEDCDIQWTDFAGISIGPNSEILDSTIEHNGDSGIGGGSSGNLISGNTVEYNNYRNFFVGWHAGGMKLIPDFSGTIEHNVVAYNKAAGIWCDSCQSGLPIIIRDNFVHDNYQPGGQKSTAIDIEVSDDAEVYNNVIMGDNNEDIDISASNNDQIYNNDLINNVSWSDFSLDGVPRTGQTLENNSFNNNLLLRQDGTTDEVIFADNDTDTANNQSDYNLFYKDNEFCVVTGGSCTSTGYTTLAGWQNATGLDTHSINADPAIVSSTPTQPSDLALQWNSPAIDAGTSTGRTTDYLGNPIYGTPDIGAIEYQPPYQMGTDEPDITANVRIYANGKFRNTAAPSGTTANLTMMPQGGFPSGDYALWMDVAIGTWDTSGDFRKTWSETGSSVSGPVLHEIGSFQPGASYQISVDSVTGAGITGTDCASGICQADENGRLTFAYSGTYSTPHIFDIQRFSDSGAGPSISVGSEAIFQNSNVSSTSNSSISNPGIAPPVTDIIAPVVQSLSNKIPITYPGGQSSATRYEEPSDEGLLPTEIDRNLKLGDQGDDVRLLQQTLNALGYDVATSGPDSQGMETTEFDENTAKALMSYQNYYQEVGVEPTGTLDNITLVLINADIQRLAAGIASTSPDEVSMPTAGAPISMSGLFSRENSWLVSLLLSLSALVQKALVDLHSHIK